MSAPERSEQPEKQTVRLNRFLASAGLGSRRKVEEFILDGRITVDGQEVLDLACTVDPDHQKVHFDGELIKPRRKRYYLLNKPPGFLCTHSDPEGRPRAIDLVPEGDEGLFTVGRLDESSQGLLLVTNDGELANRLAHPRYQVLRTYKVQVAGEPTDETFQQMKEGLYFTEGKFRVEQVRKLRSQGKSTWLELQLRQGHNREIRRLLARVGHKVLHLERVAFGPLRLAQLPVGAYRKLTREEIRDIKDFVRSARRRIGHVKHRVAAEQAAIRQKRREQKARQESNSRSRRGGARHEQSQTGRGSSHGGSQQTSRFKGNKGKKNTRRGG